MMPGSALRKALVAGLLLLPLPLLAAGGAAWAGFNRQVIHYSPAAGPISNPLMGWAPWANADNIRQPHTLVYADLTWREFEPQQGVYDFAGFESRYQLARWRAENKRVVFRFVTDRPGKTDHLDIPDWLYQAIGGSGDHYFSDYGLGFSPDYSHPLFIQHHQEALRALGERYGRDSFFAFIELGSLGHWGEWHVDTEAGIRPLPSEKIRDEYTAHYLAAFPNTFLLMRRPFNIARQKNLGLYNDQTGDFAATVQWLEWIARGGLYDQTGEEDALAAMPGAWQTAPIGGEQVIGPSHQDLYGTNLDQTLELLEKSHTTFIGPHGPYSVDPASPLQAGLDRVMERIGYRIRIEQVEMPVWVLAKKRMKLVFTAVFANDGAAPMYYHWPAQFYILAEDGSIQKTTPSAVDVTAVLPGRLKKFKVSAALDGLPPGRYRLGFAITDPASGLPAIRLAMDNPRGDLIYDLGGFEIITLRHLLPFPQ